jgi:hypothetical protein
MAILSFFMAIYEAKGRYFLTASSIPAALIGVFSCPDKSDRQFLFFHPLHEHGRRNASSWPQHNKEACSIRLEGV